MNDRRDPAAVGKGVQGESSSHTRGSSPGATDGPLTPPPTTPAGTPPPITGKPATKGTR